MTITSIRSRCFVTWYTLRFVWLDLMWILDILSLQDELERLVVWSGRKRLKGVKAHYIRLLKDVEMRLSYKRLKRPYLTEVAKWVYCAVAMLNPPPDVYPKGAGAKYSLRNRSLI
jgi:hypothetical protein